MKKIGVLNKDISEVIAGMGHTDSLVIADAGLPIPKGVRRIDLALTPGTPGFIETVKAVCREIEVQEIILAEEIVSSNPEVYALLKEIFSDVQTTMIPHEQLKELSKSTSAVIRSGECTPYANIIIVSGVIF